jgi:hypothetical protein
VVPAAHADVEPWYTYWGIGLARIDYPADLQNAVDQAESLSYVDRTQVAIDRVFHCKMSLNKGRVSNTR